MTWTLLFLFLFLESVHQSLVPFAVASKTSDGFIAFLPSFHWLEITPRALVFSSQIKRSAAVGASDERD
jgi:hypothetical protein